MTETLRFPFRLAATIAALAFALVAAPAAAQRADAVELQPGE